MLQIIFAKRINGSEIVKKLDKETYDNMFNVVCERTNYCYNCGLEEDMYRSSYCTTVSKDRERSDLPYFHEKQWICSGSRCNFFCGNKSPKERNTLLTNGKKPKVDWDNLDNIKKDYDVWASSSLPNPINHCTSEIEKFIHSKEYMAILDQKLKYMKKNKYGCEFDTVDDLIEVIQGYGGICCVTGIPLSPENCDHEFDRYTDDKPYSKANVLFVIKGINRGKNCGSQGVDNNMFQNETTFIKFVVEHGEKYGLKKNNGDNIQENIIIYMRHFYFNLL